MLHSIWSDDPSLTIYIIAVGVLLIPYCLIRNLVHLAPFATFANILNTVGLVIIFQYIVRDLPDQSIRPPDKSYEKLPLYFGTALFTYEGIGLVSWLNLYETALWTFDMYKKTWLSLTKQNLCQVWAKSIAKSRTQFHFQKFKFYDTVDKTRFCCWYGLVKCCWSGHSDTSGLITTFISAECFMIYFVKSAWFCFVRWCQ